MSEFQTRDEAIGREASAFIQLLENTGIPYEYESTRDTLFGRAVNKECIRVSNDFYPKFFRRELIPRVITTFVFTDGVFREMFSGEE